VQFNNHVTTISRVAEDLGEDEEWLRDVVSEMEIEEGVIWVSGIGLGGPLTKVDAWRLS